MVALRKIARPAVRTGAAGDGRADHHAVARPEVAHHVANPFDDADALVAEDGSWFHSLERAAHEMQVRAANGRGGKPHDGVGRLLQDRLRHVLQPDVADAVKDDRFHLGYSFRAGGERVVRGSPSWCST
jgi:hypothetical protein